MRVLVAVASKHGSTLEIAKAVGDVLIEKGIEATVTPVEDAPAVEDHDAAVLGSAVYMGRWMASAREFVEANEAALASRPVWLFSSGPVGDPPMPTEDPVDVTGLMEVTGAREHRLFAGKLDRSRLGFGEKAVVLALRAPQGDFRDWDAIRQWARGVAESLSGDDAS